MHCSGIDGLGQGDFHAVEAFCKRGGECDIKVELGSGTDDRITEVGPRIREEAVAELDLVDLSVSRLCNREK